MNLASLKKSTKVFGLVFLVMILLLATVFLGKGAQTLFSRAASCDAQNVSAVQVSANSAVVSWESANLQSGKVDYGTNAGNLNFSAPESTSGKTHNVPLTLLTPNTVYYYLIGVGGNKCDSTGQSCKDAACVPWSFTTASVTPQQQIVAPIVTPTVSATPSATLSASPSASPTSNLSAFCTQVKLNIGAGSNDATKWAILKQYDMDGNGFINGMDVLKCQKSGK